MQGKVDEARAAVEQAIKLSRTNSDPALKLPAAIQKARVEMASASRGSIGSSLAAQHLHATITTARKLGYYRLETEARLAMAELQLKINAADGRASLTTLASEAHEHSLELLARRAEDALAARSAAVAENKPAR